MRELVRRERRCHHTVTSPDVIYLAEYVEVLLPLHILYNIGSKMVIVRKVSLAFVVVVVVNEPLRVCTEVLQHKRPYTS
jgi:hypothetical protein